MAASTGTAATVSVGTKRDQAQNQYCGRQMSSGGCGGEGCVSRNPWPVHHVRYRSNLCRLCTSCVLRNHPGSFCSKCFDLIETSSGRFSHHQHLPQPAVVHCVSCTSVCHTTCLSDAEKASSYVCPSCANPNGYSFFPLDCNPEPENVSASPSKRMRASDAGGEAEENPPEADGQGKGRRIDLESAKVLLAAARLASASMNKAVAVVRSEAERKAKDAVVARKKAKEMLEKVLMVAKNERNQRRSGNLSPASEAMEPQSKASLKMDNRSMPSRGSPKNMNSRERENRWMDVHEAIPLSQRSPVRAITMGDPGKVSFSTNLDSKDSSMIVANSGIVQASMGKVTAESKVARAPPRKQDSPISSANRRVVFTGLPDKAGLHS